MVFTGRRTDSVHKAEKEYKDKFPDVEITGYHIDSLIDERTVNEDAVKEIFEDLDSKGVFIETLVLNAADQGLGMKMFYSPVEDFMKVLNTNVTWNYCLCEAAASRMKKNGGGNIVFINSNIIGPVTFYKLII